MYGNRVSTWHHLLSLAIILSCAHAKMDIKMTKIECLNYGPEIMKNVSCHINETTNSGGTFSVEFSLTEDLNDVKGHFLLSVKRGSTIIDYFSMDLDFCQLLKSQHSNYLIKSLSNEVRRHSNFPFECPFVKNKRYYVEDYCPDKRIIPSYLPEFSFISDTKINYKNKKVLHIIIYGSLVRS